MLLLHSSPPLRFAIIPFFPSSPLHRQNLPFSPSSRPSLKAHFRPLIAADLPDSLPPPSDLDSVDDGPVELFPSAPNIFAVDDNPSPLQVATSVLLTGAISVFLFRSIRRRARLAKEKTFRSSGVKSTKDLKEEALESLKALRVAPVEAGKPPSPVQALLGGIAAGVIALILYKFTLTIEAALNRQTISDNFSVRQITITIRTIINGLCYLATFVFGINSIGLVLYAGQLAISSIMEGPESAKSTPMKDAGQLNKISAESTNTNVMEPRSDGIQENIDDTKKL